MVNKLHNHKIITNFKLYILFRVPDTTNALASIEMTGPTSAIVEFTPSPNQQRDVNDNGLQGQFIVQYDVDRTSNGGEILVHILNISN